MTEERVSPLYQRIIEDMRIRGMGDLAYYLTQRPVVSIRRQTAHYRLAGNN